MVSGTLDWRSSKCVRRVRGERLGIGIESSNELPESVQLKAWFGKRKSIPTKWEALRTLVEKSFDLLPLPIPKGPEPDWAKIAERCLQRLQDKQLLITRSGVTGFVSMLQSGGSASDLTLELMCNASIARSLLLAKDLPGLGNAGHLVRSLIEDVIPRFFREELGVYVNDFPNKPTTDGVRDVVETWYALYNLYVVLQIARWSNDQLLLYQSRRCLDAFTKIVHELDYFLPMFLNLRSRTAYGAAQNPSCLGIYAAICVYAAGMYAAERRDLLEEAQRSLRILRRFPIEALYHESCQLSLAATAAHILSRDRDYESMLTWRDDFVRLLLMTMYRSAEHAGLFQACAGIMYPAFKENVEAVESLSNFVGKCRLPLRDVLTLSLHNNLAYVQDTETNPTLPVEALGTYEFPDAKSVGTAVYAIGHVLDMARLQSRLASSR